MIHSHQLMANMRKQNDILQPIQLHTLIVGTRVRPTLSGEIDVLGLPLWCI